MGLYLAVLVAFTAAAIAVAAFHVFSPGRHPDAPHDWNGRAFCPVCALPATKGRAPEQGIFIHKQDGNDAIYDLELPQPVAEFHRRFCIPSMGDAEAVRILGVVAQRDGRPTLVASRIDLRAGIAPFHPEKQP